MYAIPHENTGGLVLKLSDKTILVCDCGRTMSVDGASLAQACGVREVPTIHHSLCKSELVNFEKELGNTAIVVGCTQERPLFVDTVTRHELQTSVHTVNIREHAAWGEEGGNAQPKIAALLAAAAIDSPPVQSITLSSTGRVLVYGRDEVALEAANQLAKRLEVVLVLDATEPIAPPSIMGIEIFCGHIRRAAGYLGAFRLDIDGFAAADPSARSELSYLQKQDSAELDTDLILDVSGGTSLFQSSGKREGYFGPDPNDPARVQRALFDLVDFVGTFDKPRYVEYDGTLCVHSRSEKIGCTRCIDTCPNSAITSAGDGVSIDAFVCEGCGQCASLCPTGAASYAFPAPAVSVARLRTLLTAYVRAGGLAPVLLIYDGPGAEILNAIGRFGRGLPANVLPYEVNEITVTGLDTLLLARAYGADHVLILGPRRGVDAIHALEFNVQIALDIFEGLGIGGSVDILDETDPVPLEKVLFKVSRSAAADPPLEAGTFLPMGNKRDRMWLALDYLHANSDPLKQAVPLPPGAPFGAIDVQAEGCTLCLACVSACPTGALLDNPELPELSFLERSCVQCGLCRSTCPESVISLKPQIDFRDDARLSRVLKQEEPFECVRCGKPFGVRSSVELMVDKLRNHPMFSTADNALDRIRMCADCRVIVQFDTKQPLSRGARPKPRTADDYLKKENDSD